MRFSTFGTRFTRRSGILQLMDDLGRALSEGRPVNMLGGGNPAHIPAVEQVFADTLRQAADSGAALESLSNYSTPQGDARLIAALAAYFRSEYGWDIGGQNIALTNGSQNAFFYLFNLFGGRFDDGSDKSILLPLSPEYIGYADTHVDAPHFLSVPPRIEAAEYNGRSGFFKYRIDFAALESLPALHEGKIGAICCSRPTNPSGNVLTDGEMARLDALARTHGIPLIIDNAYGMPFPDIIHVPARLDWHGNIILCFSLSKTGLPGVRTGIVVAAPEVVAAIGSLNAVTNLAPTRFGAAVAAPLIESGTLQRLSAETIRPFYQKQADLAVSLLEKHFSDGLEGRLNIHRPEGAIFLWLWFPGLPVSAQTLYERLKARGTLVIPGEPFFIGFDTANYPHARECIRISIAQDGETLDKGIAAIAEEVRKAFAEAG
ncbi:2-aminoadipate transaminase [Kingella potus]|uniref:Putative 8-amino-7-oxononanoate synthase n=1 Tax=Kingella potus TaxID=265175 RepID=A0A377R0I0_9NEIS|nr:valine--pyruvate transaminase [Kingella potus]STR00599.1 2-aminoadipate transaminase [Kingella potus]